MKVCIPVASADGLNAALVPNFGAAQHLLIVDSDDGSVQAVDRNAPAQISAGVLAGIEGILCGEIHPRHLFELQQTGIQVFGCEADTAAAALALLRAGQLQAVPPMRMPPGQHGGCAGKGRSDPDHVCCGGGNHQHDHEHDHDHAHDGDAHAHGEHECCGGKNHAAGHGGCGGQGRGRHGEGGCAHKA